MLYANPRLVIDSSNPPEPGRIVWRSPSNIALIKYWGKHGDQLPRNPSISFTLAASLTDMALDYQLKESPSHGIALDFYFHEAENEAFKSKIADFLQKMLPVFPFLEQLELTLHSGNSFPHSAGIASSASAMSALALCLCSLEDKLFGTLPDPDAFDRKASWVARLASGSACRSIYPYAAVWGKHSAVPDADDAYAVGAEAYLHPVFQQYHDDILIVSADEKAVSSRAGHALMEGNPFAEPRYAQARRRFDDLLLALKKGDLEAFGAVVEDEALTLHALMMASNPSYILLKPGTLAIIEKVRAYRHDTGHPVYFTLDAGPNIHLLYPETIIADVRGFIDDALLEHCENGYVQQDWVGEGPEEI